MDSILNWLKDVFAGQYAVLAWFVLAIVVLCIPVWLIVLRRRKDRGEDYRRQDSDVAVVRIMRSEMTGILTVNEADGEKPVLVSQGARVFLYLTPGEHTLSLSYQWAQVEVLTAYNTNVDYSAETVKKHVVVEPHGKYTLRYDPGLKDCVLANDQAW